VDDARGEEGAEDEREPDQLSVSGETVFNLYFDLAHVRHEAFSSLDRSP
jgi:hypothetical protein